MRTRKTVPLHVVMWFVILLFTVPTIWLILTSFKSRVDTFAMPPKFFFDPILDNYAAVIGDTAFIRYYLNSIIVAVTTSFLSLAVGLPAAYAFARFQWKHREQLAFWILSTRMAPPILVVLPFYLVFRNLGLLNTRLALVLVYLTFNLAFVVWLMKGYFAAIPKDLEESARVDGAVRLRALIDIILPVSAPGIAACMVFTFITSWNEYFYALILSGTRSQTVPVAVNSFITLVGIRWGEVTAAGTLILLPVVIFGILVKKHLISGLTMGAIK